MAYVLKCYVFTFGNNLNLQDIMLTIYETTGRVSCYYDQESFLTDTAMLIA
jgi:hypothetical protein